MARLTLTIDCGNAVFDNDPRPELARILAATACKIADGVALDGLLFDANGNKVGHFTYA